MLLYIMLCILLAYLMLFAALSIAVCLYNASFLLLIFASALSWFIRTLFVYFKHHLPSCAVVLIFGFS